MSIKLTEIEMEDGSMMAFEYEEVENEELQAVGFFDVTSRKERMEKMKVSMESTLKMFGDSVLPYMDKELINGVKPKSVSLDFGLQFGGEMGVPFVTKGSAKANFKVSITWDVKKDE